MLDLTIAIPVRNEEKNLPHCLAAIGKNLAQKIIIIDSGSIDRTKEIARESGAEILEFVWNGKYPKKRNWFLQNYIPTTNWILFLDADEYLTEEFKNEIANALNVNDKVGYWLKYSIHFMDRKLKGGYPLKKLALFRFGAGKYEYINEQQWSSLDMEVHEHPVLHGKIGYLHSKIDHLDFRGIAHYINKHNEYADWEAARYLKIVEIENKKWTYKQRIKYRLMRSVWIGPAYFFGTYFLLGGFLDGSIGFIYAAFKMSYFIQVNCKIKEMQNARLNSRECITN